ncbi:radical SAM/SPASM domain-containing protein [Desulfomonile tiedjei]|uniref:radical SAM/SPASM domain-containing protein n=1 Tax=Desulfomonile tiedjei TaxID=2358 RepID=UPI00059D2F5F|nr:radical SAM/SPASM domain-containing protein [Desulfomonile tiedjei]
MEKDLKTTHDVPKKGLSGLVKKIASWFSGPAPEHVPRSAQDTTHSQESHRPWRLLQVETALACNLRCVMCPWKDYRQRAVHGGVMSPEIWEAVRPHLKKAQTVDFTGGGEPLLQPNLAHWIREAKSEGCMAGILTNAVLLNDRTARDLLDTGLDWICISIDGSSKEEYETIRVGANFDQVRQNVEHFSKLRTGKFPKMMINHVMMRANVNQLEQMVRLCADLGIDQINFKQCEVIRDTHGKGLGLFGRTETREIKQFQRAVAAARKLAQKFGMETTASSFLPEERPVCEQDPRNSMFIRYDGLVAPCINLANSGPTVFLGQEVVLPDVHYGTLPECDLQDLWQSELCGFYRRTFEARTREYDNVFMEGLMADSRRTPERMLEMAIKRMPKPPKGCEICHYLYGI